MSPFGPVVDSRYFSTLVGSDVALRLLKRAGLVNGEAPPANLGVVDFWRLCAENIEATNDESHGVAAEPVARGSLSVLFTAAKEADDLMGAIDRLAEASRLVRKECRITVGKGRDTVRLTVRPTGDSSARAEVYCECFLIVAHCALRWMTGQALRPISARGAGALKAFGGGVLLALRAPLGRRGDGATLVYRRQDMDTPILAQKYAAWGEVEFNAFLELLRDDSLAAPPSPDVEGVILAFDRGLWSQEEVAQWLGVSVATLRRQLARAGHTFRDLSADARRAELQDLLATAMPTWKIAERLGLSDDRSLRRFCAEHLGTSPRAYRRLHARVGSRLGLPPIFH